MGLRGSFVMLRGQHLALGLKYGILLIIEWSKLNQGIFKLRNKKIEKYLEIVEKSTKDKISSNEHLNHI
jgi:hypothetical protein